MTYTTGEGRGTRLTYAGRAEVMRRLRNRDRVKVRDVLPAVIR